MGYRRDKTGKGSSDYVLQGNWVECSGCKKRGDIKKANLLKDGGYSCARCYNPQSPDE